MLSFLRARMHFAEQRFKSLTDVVQLPNLGVSLPLSEIYRDLDLT